MTINVELMQDTLDYIATHPEEHDQGTWGEKTDCGTVRCMAGTAVHLSEDWNLAWSLNGDTVFGAVDKQGNIERVSVVAGDILGLDDDQKDALFYDAVNLEELYAVAEDMTGIDMRVPERELVSV